jgi:hypothetical protein
MHACLSPRPLSVSDVPDPSPVYRVSTRDAGHKMQRFIALGDSIGYAFNQASVWLHGLWGSSILVYMICSVFQQRAPN